MTSISVRIIVIMDCFTLYPCTHPRPELNYLFYEAHVDNLTTSYLAIKVPRSTIPTVSSEIWSEKSSLRINCFAKQCLSHSLLYIVCSGVTHRLRERDFPCLHPDWPAVWAIRPILSESLVLVNLLFRLTDKHFRKLGDKMLSLIIVRAGCKCLSIPALSEVKLIYYPNVFNFMDCAVAYS